jgi:hypothetical protein
LKRCVEYAARRYASDEVFGGVKVLENHDDDLDRNCSEAGHPTGRVEKVYVL